MASKLAIQIAAMASVAMFPLEVVDGIERPRPIEIDTPTDDDFERMKAAEAKRQRKARKRVALKEQSDG